MAKITRRNALRLVSLAGATYSLSSWSPFRAFTPARAADAAPPRRIVFFYTEQGTLKKRMPETSDGVRGLLEPIWTPKASGMAKDGRYLDKVWQTSDFELRDIHQPLTDFKKKLLMLHGVDMLSNLVDPTPATNSHIRGQTHALIGDNRQSGSIAGGISIDQYIATSINSPSALTALRSLELFIDAKQGQSGGEAAPLYAGSGQPVPIEGNAGVVYDRMLPNGPKNDENVEKIKRQIAQQKSVLDFAQQEFATLSKNVSAIDKKRLDAHASAIRDLENRLDLGSNVACIEPDRTVIDTGSTAGTAEAYAANADLHMRLATTALACDLTRVVTMYVTQAHDDLFGYKSDGRTSDFHDMCHKTNGEAWQRALANDDAAIGTVKAYHTYNASMFAKFLGMLDAVPDVGGTTLLDNTLVVWCGQIADGDHEIDHIPYVLGGGMGGGVTPGRFVMYPRSDEKGAWPVYSKGPAHNDLFVKLANLMGVETDTFGNPEVCTGPLPGLS